MTANPTDPPRKLVHHHDNGEPHFLTFSCYHRLKLLSKDRTRHWFLQALSEARSLHGFHLWAWVIMPEHVHVLLWPPYQLISCDSAASKQTGSGVGTIRGILSSIKRPVANKAIAYLKRKAPNYLKKLEVQDRGRTSYRFWQAGSGYDENITEPQALHQIVEYIHMNPVRRGLVDRPEQWRWSSAADWLRKSDSMLHVDRTIPELLEVPWQDRRATRSW